MSQARSASGRMPMSAVDGVRVTATAYLDAPLLAGSLELRADARSTA